MQPTSQLSSLIENVQGLCRDNESPETVAALLWLIASSEDCRRTLEASAPSREDLEKLCDRLGNTARAWVQFSPAACDLLNREEPAPAARSERTSASPFASVPVAAWQDFQSGQSLESFEQGSQAA